PNRHVDNFKGARHPAQISWPGSHTAPMNVSGRRLMFGRRTFLAKCELVHTPRPISKRFCRESAAWPSKSALEVLSVARPRCGAVHATMVDLANKARSPPPSSIHDIGRSR